MGICGHLIEAGALVLELLLKPIDLPLQTQYVLLLGSQSLIERLHRVLNKRDLRLKCRYVPH